MTRQADYIARRLQSGAVRRTFILSPEAGQMLAELAERHGSQTKALEDAIRLLWGRPPGIGQV